jgi:hypothetical protein
MKTHANKSLSLGWVHTPHMFYEVYWNTPLFADMWTQGAGSQPFVLSNGDNTGYSLHADFISGWDVPTLQQIIENCDAGDSGMDKCPGLIGGINDASTSCNIPEAIDENIHGVLDALPGNNPITGWGVSGSPPAESSAGSSSVVASKTSSVSSAASPASTATYAPGGGYGYSSSSVVPTTLALSTTSSAASVSHILSSTASSASSAAVSHSAPATSSKPASTPPSASSPVKPTATSSTAPPTSSATNPSIPGWTYAGCYSDKLSPRAIGTSGIQFAYLGQHNVTTTSCVAYCDAAGYSIAGTEYAGQCFCDNKLASYSTTIAQSECSMPCEGQGGSEQLCGGGLALSVYTKGGVQARGYHHFGRLGFHKRSKQGW